VKLTFVQLRTYVSDAHRLRLTDDDLRDLEGLLLERPTAGAVIAGTGGLRKLRHAPRRSSSGKSGGVRVCYAYFPAFSHLFFVVAFAKNEQANLTPNEKREIRTLLKQIEQELQRRPQ
jgi:hypothetical protein